MRSAIHMAGTRLETQNYEIENQIRINCAGSNELFIYSVSGVRGRIALTLSTAADSDHIIRTRALVRPQKRSCAIFVATTKYDSFHQ